MLLKYNKTNNALYFYSEDVALLKLPNISRAYTDQGPCWEIPLSYPAGYMCLKTFKALYPKAKADPEAIVRIKALKDYHDTDNLIPDGYEFRYAPYLHQLRSVNCMLKYPKFALLLEMGLGKTFVSLNYMAIQKQLLGKFFTVVVCPKIVIYNWQLECEKYTDLKCWVYKKGKAMPPDTDMLVINYDKLILDYAIDFVKSLNADCFILDEASRVKSHKSKRSKSLEKLLLYTEYKYLLSGALVLGNPLDTFQPYRILSHDILGSNFWQFRQNYAILKINGSRRFVVGYKNLDKLKACIDPYSLMLKREECIDLPDRVFVRHYYDMTPKQRSMYHSVVTMDQITLLGDIELNTSASILKLGLLMQILSGFVMLPESTQLRHCNTCVQLHTCIQDNVKPYTHGCILDPEDKVKIIDLGDGKLELLKEDLDLIEGKVIIWVMFRRDLYNVEALLRTLKYQYILSTEPGSDVKFQNDPDLKVYLGQISTGIGTTLTKAATTIYYSHSLNLEHRLQSLDRNYRISQKQKVVVIDYVCKDSIEQRVLELLEKKEDVKTFVQTRSVCTECTDSMRCFERGVAPYTQNCIHFEKRIEAEKKVTIKIEEFDNVDIINEFIHKGVQPKHNC